MKAFGMATCGSNMEVRFLTNGDPVGEVSLAFRLGKKDKQTGEYLTQWVKATLFGKRAESLSPYILKGSKHAFHLKDMRVEEYTTKEGEKRSILRADIDDVELGGQKQAAPAQHSASRAATTAQAPAQPRQAQRPAASGGGASGFDDMDDDIPFLVNMNTVRDTMGTSKSISRAKYGKTLHLLRCNQTDC